MDTYQDEQLDQFSSSRPLGVTGDTPFFFTNGGFS
jgi:hypothetical protein